jgi:glycosyltransferase involved in cell wall biosynthesis
MDQQSKPFISVLLPAYNGAATIGTALDSLVAQDYPADRYEVIVVNDGSTDDTASVVAERQNLRYIELPHNMGIAPAQNAGLDAARGEIIVVFNDDCLAAPDYLSQLVLGYLHVDKPLGIGGVVVKRAPDKVKGATANYVEAISVGNPTVDESGLDFLPPVVRRFYIYLKINYASRKNSQQDQQDQYPELVEMYGANSSFLISELRQVGGWDTSMAAPGVGGIEDRDVCFRLRKRFPDRHFYSAGPAQLILDQDLADSAVSFKSHMLRQYRRGPFNYAFHVKHGLVPPLFPFPPLILCTLLAYSVAVALVQPLLLLFLPLLLVLLPQVCYGWWIKRAIVARRPVYLLFPYFQWVEETMVLAGLLRGYLRFRRMARVAETVAKEPADQHSEVDSI